MTLEEIEAAWAARDEAALAAGGAELGIELTLGKLDRLVGGSVPRPTRQILAALSDASTSESGIALRTWHDRGSWTCLAVSVPERIVATLLREPIPSRTWPELKPWYRELGRNRERAVKWASSTKGQRIVFARRARVAPESPATGIEHERELLAQIAENPDDATTRLVLADLLMGRGDPRGELIRLSLEPTPDLKRIAALETEHRQHLAGDVMDHAKTFRFVGGFVDSVTMTAGAFRQHGERLLQRQPIRELELHPHNAQAMATLAKAPALPKLRALRMHGSYNQEVTVTFEELGDVVLERLERLSLEYIKLPVFPPTLRAPRLRSIYMRWMHVSNETFGGLFQNRMVCDALETVELGVWQPSGRDESRMDAAFEHLRSGGLPRLTTYLAPSLQYFESDGRMETLVLAAPALETFVQSGAPRTVEALGHCPRLRRLELQNCIEPDQLERLLPKWPALEVLKIERRGMSDADCKRIAELLLALPTTHPLRVVNVRNYESTDLQARFS